MNRLTKQKNKSGECRIIKCTAKDWNLYKHSSEDICKNCPFKYYINKLGEYEDEQELLEDDLK